MTLKDWEEFDVKTVVENYEDLAKEIEPLTGAKDNHFETIMGFIESYKKLSFEDRKEISDIFLDKARINRAQSTIHFGSDTTEEAINRNRFRGAAQLREAEKYERWAEALL